MEYCVYRLGGPSQVPVQDLGGIDSVVGVKITRDLHLSLEVEFIAHVQECRWRSLGREEYFSKVVEISCVGDNRRLEDLE